MIAKKSINLGSGFFIESSAEERGTKQANCVVGAECLRLVELVDEAAGSDGVP